jgi:hypothetical protein
MIIFLALILESLRLGKNVSHIDEGLALVIVFEISFKENKYIFREVVLYLKGLFSIIEYVMR